MTLGLCDAWVPIRRPDHPVLGQREQLCAAPAAGRLRISRGAYSRDLECCRAHVDVVAGQVRAAGWSVTQAPVVA